MRTSYANAFVGNLLGHAPRWYKATFILFLLVNPILVITAGTFAAGWALIGEFIFTLAMALKCYPLSPGGMLALEAVVLGMTSPDAVYNEALANFEVLLLLIFMVAGIYFMKDLLQFTFTRILVTIRSKLLISQLFCIAGALLSAFLDALTVTAVIIAVAYGFYNVYHRYVSGKGYQDEHDLCDDGQCRSFDRDDLMRFRGFLRNLMMHGAVGTALGGVCTLVGEPQNLLIGAEMGWHFGTFFVKVAPISMPVLATGLATCALVERFSLCRYGVKLPEVIRIHMQEASRTAEKRMDHADRVKLAMQACCAVWLVVGLAFHLAAVGIIGLSVIVILTTVNGITEEHRLGRAFEEALPFTALLVVFFAVVAVIHDQHLFKPVIDYVLHMKGSSQMAAYYAASGLLSAISDNVFVATVYITETKMHFTQMLHAVPGIGMTGQALMDMLTDSHLDRADVLAGLPAEAAGKVREIMDNFDKLAIAINTGTNIPSVATPNGQAAFLFLLTSALAPVIRLSYGRMVILALPYTITMSLAGLAAVWYMQDIVRFFCG
ncbi:MAG: sodium/proton antiporter NhaB [Desulfovibrionaceae bacterium]|nr:sodium/proton antiporter NhaB [Desulfovibrionaceae bacterium]